MSDLVSGTDIERIVGISRHWEFHYGRADSGEQRVYILHSRRCLNAGIDLRDCPYSLALDRGICEEDWDGFEDIPIALKIRDGRLVPLFPEGYQ